LPLAARRVHADLATANKKPVNTETRLFTINRPTSKIPGTWPGDELDVARRRKASATALERSIIDWQEALVAIKGPPTDPCFVKKPLRDDGY